jgi:NAD(P)-dependent dehydrogenase (short-subunit alcohol dehydrogenase family)
VGLTFGFPSGANSILGIGRATAHLFAGAGAKAVYICDYDGSNLETHKRELNALYPTVDIHVRQFDAADEKSVKAVVDHAIEHYGRLDVFFANAGIIGPHAVFTDISKEDFMKVLDTNTARFVKCMVSRYMHSVLIFRLAYS